MELLAHIFVLCSEDDSMLPISVSHVCSVWRHVALRTPPLWRRICVDSRAELWRERIYRAKACSLDIKLLPFISKPRGFLQPQYLDYHTVQWHMYLVTPLIHRWRSLEVEFRDYAPFLWNAALSECCSAGRDAQAPILEQLTLVYPRNDDGKEFCLFSGFAPRLRLVKLDGVCLTWLPSLFSNLTHLDYVHHGFTSGPQAVHDVISMIRISSRLVELRISFPRSKVHHSRQLPNHRIPRVSRNASLPHLRTLHLRVTTTDIPLELVHLASHIHSSSLTSLHLVDLGHHRAPFPNLYSFLQLYAIPSSVQMFSVEHGWYDRGMLSYLLRRLPNIRDLLVKRSHMQDQRFRDQRWLNYISLHPNLD